MIHFKKVRYKNLLSSGNRFTTFELDRSNTTLIVGDNGAGKSTLLDALCFGLYGKGFRNLNFFVNYNCNFFSIVDYINFRYRL